jgi:perosamine synthetase
VTVHEIAIDEPVFGDSEVRFAWTVTPQSALYRRTSFHLRFPETVEVAAVPRSLWWRIGLICLHAHWPLLRPCRVLLPVRLPPAEEEFWLRMTDAAVATLEAHAGGHDTGRAIELIGSGPFLGPPEPATVSPIGGVVSCFSGGRDSITQAAMLRELGQDPALVTVTSPGPWSPEHDTLRRREVLSEMTHRSGLELIEVTSDLRAGWENAFAAPRYGLGVNECSDAMLFMAAATAVAAARGARLVTLASEAEVQENARRSGMVVQMRHFMYSVVTQRALSAMLAPAGIALSSLTSSLRQFQVQRLLATRYPSLRDLQYSCWELSRDQAACSRCPECRKIALNLVAEGVDPGAAGIDLLELLLSLSDWSPGQRHLNARPRNRVLTRGLAGREHEMQEIRCLARADRHQVAALLDGSGASSDRTRALAIYERLHQQALEYEIEPEPGYLAGYLELLDGETRRGVRDILDGYFTPASPESYRSMLLNTRQLSEWIADPLNCVGIPSVREEPDAPTELIAGPEPVVQAPPGRRVLTVADTLLDGNESRYVQQCLADNWISSAGSFVPRLESEFARAVGCRFAIACSSGTAALHLALAATGVGAGDEVLIPAFTMIATASAPCYLGADPVLVDADPSSWNLDPAALADKLTTRTRALIVVHTYGQPAEMEPILEFARRNRLIVVEDAAEAHGARYRGQPVGGLGDAAAFSLYANKIVTSGEGGIVTTNDPQVAELARELRDHAFSRERHFWHRRLGYNYRMTNLQAAVGVAQVERFDELVALRQRLAERYDAALAGIDGVEPAPRQPGGVTWMYGIRIGEAFGISRDELRRRLAARGVETRTFFVPLHLQPVHSRRFAGQRYPVAEALGRTGLYLPSGPRLTVEDVAYIAEAVRAAARSGHGTTPTSE